MNEWTTCWLVIDWSDAHRVEDGKHYSVDGQTHFHIADARHYEALLGEPWEIWHMGYQYRPEEWVGDTWHFMNRGADRSVNPKPENFRHAGYVIPDYVPMPPPPEDPANPKPHEYAGGAWHWKHPATIEHLKTLNRKWVHPPDHPPAHILKR